MSFTKKLSAWIFSLIYSWKGFLFLVVGLTYLILTLAVPRGVAGTNVSCARCHEMLPEVATWQVSSHARVNCQACHPLRESDFKDIHASGFFSRPIRLQAAFDDKVCLQCHTSRREATVSGDLIVPHDRHYKAGIGCASCHASVAHANLSARGLTVKGELADYKAWNAASARKVATAFNTRPDMQTCLNCHKKRSVNTPCAACHKKIPGLPSHERLEWRSEHGLAGRADNSGCIKCHTPKGEKLQVSPATGDAIANFARASEFCYSCHLQRPLNHSGLKLPEHPERARKRGLSNCLTCHDLDQPSQGAKAAVTYCNMCHRFQK